MPAARVIGSLKANSDWFYCSRRRRKIKRYNKNAITRGRETLLAVSDTQFCIIDSAYC